MHPYSNGPPTHLSIKHCAKTRALNCRVGLDFVNELDCCDVKWVTGGPETVTVKEILLQDGGKRAHE